MYADTLCDAFLLVRKAYRRRALETHPDKMPLTTEGVKESAAARFRDVRALSSLHVVL